MFSYDFDGTFEDVFEDKKHPEIVRLCHNYNNPGWTYNYHLHKDATEIAYIADGKVDYTINQMSYTLEKGQLLIIEKGVLHSTASDSKNPVDLWTCVISNYKFKSIIEENRMLFSNMHYIAHAGKNENFIKSTMEQLYHTSLHKTPSANYVCNALATSLASVIFEMLPKCEQADRKLKSSFVRDILMYISEHYNEPITLKQLSEVFHMSPGYISHEFAKEYGVSPINYAIGLRVSEAKWLLINTKHSLSSISQKVGYENTTHFTNMFLKRVNFSPLEFRKIHSRDNNILLMQ